MTEHKAEIKGKPEKKEFTGNDATFCYSEGYNQAIDDYEAWLGHAGLVRLEDVEIDKNELLSTMNCFNLDTVILAFAIDMVTKNKSKILKVKGGD